MSLYAKSISNFTDDWFISWTWAIAFDLMLHPKMLYLCTGPNGAAKGFIYIWHHHHRLSQRFVHNITNQNWAFNMTEWGWSLAVFCRWRPPPHGAESAGGCGTTPEPPSTARRPRICWDVRWFSGVERKTHITELKVSVCVCCIRLWNVLFEILVNLSSGAQ